MATVNIRWQWTTAVYQSGSRYYVDYLIEDLDTDPVESTTGSLQVEPNMTIAELETAMQPKYEEFANRNNWKTTIDAEVGDARTVAVTIPDPEV